MGRVGGMGAVQGDLAPLAVPTGNMVGAKGMQAWPCVPHSCLGPTLTRIMTRGGSLAPPGATRDQVPVTHHYTPLQVVYSTWCFWGDTKHTTTAACLHAERAHVSRVWDHGGYNNRLLGTRVRKGLVRYILLDCNTQAPHCNNAAVVVGRLGEGEIKEGPGPRVSEWAVLHRRGHK